MKFYGIILVIIGHMTAFGAKFIFSFHMPLFFIIAGYFYHPKEIKYSIKNDIRRLIYPYILTASFILCAYILVSFFKEDIDVKYWFIASLYGNGSFNHTSLYFAKAPSIGAIWFLMALFWCKNAFNIIYAKFKHWLIISFIIAFFAIAIDKYLINLPFAILPGLSALIFFSIGHIIRQKGGFLKISPFVWSVIILIWIIDFLVSDMSMVRCYYKDILVNIIGACGGTYVMYLISNLTATYKNNFVRLITWGGKQLDVSLHSSLRFGFTSKSINTFV